MLGMKNHFDISDSIEIGEVDIAGVACNPYLSHKLPHTVFEIVVSALHNLLQSNLDEGLVDHNPKSCIVCRPELGNHSDTETAEQFNNPVNKVIL